MEELKFTGTLRSERILPDVNYRKAYQQLRAALVAQRKQPYPQVEVIIRYRDPRQEWIDRWYIEARRCGVKLTFRKDVVIAFNDFGDIATAAPVHGDKYDRHTGIAVAYAKLCGEKIPDYI